ncbi:hypothetical protein [Synoicihabitans lomoniglobus]|uniref:Uncharacterized protein n=1 Tax=Synoicihabitans lomoniglobus TaxID=2909285 RepID=A0AAF0CHW8_9BACT|nr:hypothetical protein [Opitutaceae bacterium LMO-M01]WED64757.1 hypothetical protein PXH66_20630 [Opitutaceae bacterium LMO-M01]
MRLPLQFLAIVALSPVAGVTDGAAAVTLERVWPGYRDAASFTRLGEYFGAGPDAINAAALRSQPQARAGYYWLIRTDATAAQSGCSLIIEVQRESNPVPDTHTFSFDLSAGSHAIHAGLTGRDWIDSEERPVAWRLTLLSPDGTSLATQHSFLWERSSSS